MTDDTVQRICPSKIDSVDRVSAGVRAVYVPNTPPSPYTALPADTQNSAKSRKSCSDDNVSKWLGLDTSDYTRNAIGQLHTRV